MTSARKPLVSARAVSDFRKIVDEASGSELLLLQNDVAGIGFGRIDDKGRECGNVLGAGLDIRGPAPLALAECRACQQFAERQNTGERRADIVSECRKRGLRRGRSKTQARSRRRAGFTAVFFLAFDRTITSSRTQIATAAL